MRSSSARASGSAAAQRVEQAERQWPVRRSPGAVADEGDIGARRLGMAGLGRPPEQRARGAEVAPDDRAGEPPGGEDEEGLRVPAAARGCSSRRQASAPRPAPTSSSTSCASGGGAAAMALP